MGPMFVTISEAMYAVFNLESHKHKALIIGEDLGTVPPAVRPMMKNHGWHRLCVGQFEINPTEGRVLNETPEGASCQYKYARFTYFRLLLVGHRYRRKGGNGPFNRRRGTTGTDCTKNHA